MVGEVNYYWSTIDSSSCLWVGEVNYKKFLNQIDKMDKTAEKRDTWALDARMRGFERNLVAVQQDVQAIRTDINELMQLLKNESSKPLTIASVVPQSATGT